MKLVRNPLSFVKCDVFVGTLNSTRPEEILIIVWEPAVVLTPVIVPTLFVLLFQFVISSDVIPYAAEAVNIGSVSELSFAFQASICAAVIEEAALDAALFQDCIFAAVIPCAGLATNTGSVSAVTNVRLPVPSILALLIVFSPPD